MVTISVMIGSIVYFISNYRYTMNVSCTPPQLVCLCTPHQLKYHCTPLQVKCHTSLRWLDNHTLRDGPTFGASALKHEHANRNFLLGDSLLWVSYFRTFQDQYSDRHTNAQTFIHKYLVYIYPELFLILQCIKITPVIFLRI